jgi:hypothetical protein
MRNCEYLKPNGEFCGSPALRGRDYCHWHLICIARRLRAEKQEATQDRTPLELPPLEDANSVQLAVMMVIDAMLRQRIGPRMSGQLLYALQIASSNLKQGVCFQPAKLQSAQGKTVPPVRCTQYDALEADFDIAEHAEQLKSTELPMPVRADSGSPESPWVAHYGAVNDLGSTSPETRVLDDLLRDTLLEASRTQNPQYRRDLVLAYLRHAPEAPPQAGRAAGPQKVLFTRKPPEGVLQEWYKQRHANCSAEIDKTTEQQETARKKIG